MAPVQASLIFPIGQKDVGRLIGRGRCNIRELCQKTGCRIYVGEDSLEDKKAVDICLKGRNEEEVQKCREIVEENLGYPHGKYKPDYIVIPSYQRSLIVGQGGKTITNINKLSGAKCNIVKTSQGATSHLIIRGNSEQVKKAKSLLLNIIQYEHTDYVKVPPTQCGLIHGRGDKQLEKINQLTGATCNLRYNIQVTDVKTNYLNSHFYLNSHCPKPPQSIPYSPIENKGVIIRGTREQVQAAKSMVLKIIEEEQTGCEAFPRNKFDCSNQGKPMKNTKTTKISIPK